MPSSPRAVQTRMMDDSVKSTLDEGSSHGQVPEYSFLKGLEQSLKEQEESSDESSYWDSSDEDSDDDLGLSDDESDDDDDDEDDDDGHQTSEDERHEAMKKTKSSEMKRNDSTLSLDALLKVQMQLGDTKKAPPKDREARRRNRRLKDNSVSFGSLARMVGSSTGNETVQQALRSKPRSDSLPGIFPSQKHKLKMMHYHQQGSIQGREVQPPSSSSSRRGLSNQTPANKPIHIGGIDASNRRSSVSAGKKPRDHYIGILQKAGVTAPLVRFDTLGDFLVPLTDKDKLAFDMELVGAVRDQNLKKLQSMKKAGHPLQARSRTGESLVHICARRGTPEILRFLLSQKGTTNGGDDEDVVSCRVCCDYGRTPLHDAAWSADAASLEMMKILIHECPDLMLILDRRGFMPLDYVPRDRWAQCCTFLDKHKDMLMPTGVLYGDSESESSYYEGETSNDDLESDSDEESD